MKFWLDEIMGNHGVEEFSFQFNPIVCQHFHIVFYILSDFQNILVFIYRFEYFYKF